MATTNKYCNLYGQNKISDDYVKINQGFSAVETDMSGVLASEMAREEAETSREVAEVDRVLRYENTKHYGAYNPAFTYHRNNIASYGGSSFMLIVDESKGNAPPEYPATYNTFWALAGQKGDKGDVGEKGIQGEIGPEGPVGPQGIKGDKGATLNPRGIYNSEEQYLENDLVNDNGSVWQCLQQCKGVAPAIGLYWDIFLASGGDVTHEEFDSLAADFESHKSDTMKFSTYKSIKDSNGIYTVVQHKRADGTLIMQSTLSGGTSPKYTTRTEVWYKIDGITVDVTKVYTITYDTDGNVVSEVVA